MSISVASVLLQSTAGRIRLHGLPANHKPGFSEKRHGSLWKIVNDNRTNKGSQKVSEKEKPPLIDRRQAIVLAGLSWATSAMASPTPNPSSGDGSEKTLQGAPLTFNVGRPGKKKGDEDKEEVLTVSVRVPRGVACGFNAFINLPDAQSNTPISLPQFAVADCSRDLTRECWMHAIYFKGSILALGIPDFKLCCIGKLNFH